MGPLDGKGESGHLGPHQMFSNLKSIGATDKEALLLAGAASSESSFNPNAKHDPDRVTGLPTGHGLFGHKDERLDMRGKNWQKQSSLALKEFRHRSVRGVGKLADLLDRAHSPEDIADVEMHYEAPRGYKPNNPRDGDKYMGRINSIRRFSTMANGATAQAPIPAGTAAKPVTDAEVFAARQRLSSGGRDPKDIELRDRSLREQNTPASPPTGDAAHPVQERTLGRYIHVTKPMASRGEMPHPSVYGPSHLDPTHQKLADAMKGGASGQPIKVDLTDSSTHRLGQVTVGQAVRHTLGLIRDAQRMTHHPAPLPAHPTAAHMAWHGYPHAMDYHRSVMEGIRMAAVHRHSTVNHNDYSSETKIGSIAVHTQAKHADRMVADIEPIFRRAGEAGRRNYGLA